MQLTIQETHDLATRVMAALGHDSGDAKLIADHLIDCELRGLRLRRFGPGDQYRRENRAHW